MAQVTFTFNLKSKYSNQQLLDWFCTKKTRDVDEDTGLPVLTKKQHLDESIISFIHRVCSEGKEIAEAQESIDSDMLTRV
jgi:hypothetical protein